MAGGELQEFARQDAALVKVIKSIIDFTVQNQVNW
jgi:hypothetical protein